MTSLFLVASVLFPRMTLLVYYMMGDMPANSTDFPVDVLLAIFMPRALISIWVLDDPLVPDWWVLAYVVAALLNAGGWRINSNRSNQ